MSPLAALNTFCDWQATRLRAQLVSTAPVIQRVPVVTAPVPDRHRAIRTRGPYKRRGTAPHGTVKRYNHMGCRCQPCCDARAAYYHAYHAGQRAKQAGAAA